MTLIFNAADQGPTSVKINKGKHGVYEVYLRLNKDMDWIPTEILFIDTIQEYVKVKSVQNGKLFELFIDWFNNKLTLVFPDGNKVIHNLVK